MGEEQKLLGTNCVILKVSEINICGFVKQLKNPMVLVPGEYIVLQEGCNGFSLSAVRVPPEGAEVVCHVEGRNVKVE